MALALSRYLAFLSRRERRIWTGLVALGVVAAVVEALAATWVYALMKILAEPTAALELPVVKHLYELTGWRSPRALLASFSALVAAYYLFKNGLLAVLAWAGLDAPRSLLAEASGPVLGEAMKPYLQYGWQPQVMLEEGVRKTVDWYLANRDFVDSLDLGVRRSAAAADDDRAAA